MKYLKCIILLLSFVICSSLIWAEDKTDDFNQPELGTDWSWSGDPSIKYTLTETQGNLIIDIPGERSYNIWSGDSMDGVLMLRKDQGNGDWTIETRLSVDSHGYGYQTGLVVWSNPYVMYFWTLDRNLKKNNNRLLGEQFGISNYSSPKKAPEFDDWVVLRIEKTGKKLLLQYWDDNDQSFITYDTFMFKFPVNGVGIMARSYNPNGVAFRTKVDYFKIIR